MLNDMKIGTKLYLGFGVVLALLLVLWGVGKWGMTSLNSAMSNTLRGDVKVMEMSSRARANSLGLRRFEKDTFINIASAKDVEKYHKSWEEERERLNARLADLEKVATLPEDKTKIHDAKENLEKYGAGFTKVYQKIQAGEIKTTQEANQAMVEFKEATHKAVAEVESLAKECAQRVDVAEANMNTLVGKVGNIALAISVISLIIGIAVATLIIRAITGPLSELRATIVKVEKGHDFTLRVPKDGRDEVGQTGEAFNLLMGSLQAAFRDILGGVDRMSDATRGLSSSSSQVATSSALQSEAAAAMAATVEEVTVSISHVSDRAREALEVSHKSGELSTQGGTIIHNAATEMMQIADTVRQTSGTMEELGQQSNQISSVVQVIKDVADQTNLLALNAAIEAARAGEQGRGFAVVADEVRKLAERTSKATGEISQMIGNIQSSTRTAVESMGVAVAKVDGGVALARQAGDAINQIKDGAGQVTSVVSDISSALVEQSSASNDIAAQVEKVAQMTEENSAAAGEVASTTNRLEQLANDMRVTVGKFRI